MVTRKERREATRQRIVDAAIEAFSELGFEGASTRNIASRANANQGLVTYYFKSKEALWRAAVDHLFQKRDTQLRDGPVRLTGAPPRERAREAIRQYVRFAAANPDLAGLMLSEGKAASDRLSWLVETHLGQLYRDLAKMQPLRDRAEILPHAYYALAGAAALIFALAPECRQLTGLDPRTREAIDTHADFVADLFIPPDESEATTVSRTGSAAKPTVTAS
jgi:TetR/AcrR family transcriptional regulator